MSAEGEERGANAEAEFGEYLRRREAGENPSFEDFCAKRSAIANALRLLYSAQFGDRGAEREPRDPLGLPLRPAGGGGPGEARGDQVVRYCIRCGHEIGSAVFCVNPDCGAPNFFRNVSGPEPEPATRTTQAQRRALTSRATTLSPRVGMTTRRRTDPAFAVLRGLYPPPIEYPLYPGVMEIGARAPAEIVIDRPEVSARHAQLESRCDANGCWEMILTDRGSTNGTHVNGERIQCRRLDDGDRVRFGAGEFEIRLLPGKSRRVTMRIDES